MGGLRALISGLLCALASLSPCVNVVSTHYALPLLSSSRGAEVAVMSQDFLDPQETAGVAHTDFSSPGARQGGGSPPLPLAVRHQVSCCTGALALRHKTAASPPGITTKFQAGKPDSGGAGERGEGQRTESIVWQILPFVSKMASCLATQQKTSNSSFNSNSPVLGLNPGHAQET